MGASGGVKLCTVVELKEKWTSVRQDLIDNLNGDPLQSDAKKLPKSIGKLSGYEIVNLFSFMGSCDCPFHYHGVIVLAKGDYVSEDMRLLSSVFPGVYVETWT